MLSRIARGSSARLPLAVRSAGQGQARSLHSTPLSSSSSTPLQAAAEAAARAHEGSSGILHACMSGVEALHSATGLPWWATLSLMAVGVRAALFPVAVRGMRAGAAFKLMPAARAAAERQWRRQHPEMLRPAAAAAVRGGQPAAGPSVEGQQQRNDGAWPTTPTVPSRGNHRQQPKQPQQREEQPDKAPAPSGANPSKGPPVALVMEHLQRLRRAAGLPSPGWVLGAPLIQLPFFVTGMATARSLALEHWPGLETGGLLWFTDLTQRSVEWSTLTAPMGALGLLLPAAIVLSISSSLDAALQVPAAAVGEDEGKTMRSALIWRHAVRYLRLCADMALIPLFLISLQIPQASLCYWLTSSSITLVQGRLLRSSASFRAALGLDVDAQLRRAVLEGSSGSVDGQTMPGGLSSLASMPQGTLGDATPGSPADATKQPPGLQKFLATATAADESRLFQRAAELAAARKPGQASAVLGRILELHPKHPSAAFALGQLGAGRKAWTDSEAWYTRAAYWQQDAQQAARAWFGAGVAADMQGESLRALGLFTRVLELAEDKALRARALVAKASVHHSLGQKNDAVDLLREAAKIDPKVEKQFLAPLLNEAASK